MPGVTLVAGASVGGRRSTLSSAARSSRRRVEDLRPENSFLKPVGHGLKQKSLTDANRGFGAVENPPALLEGGGVEPAQLGELVC